MQKINNDIYDKLGDRWYSAQDDPVALLRAESRVKSPWIAERITNPKAQILDVGCGAGFLSNDLGKLGFDVTGIDLSEDSLRVAGEHDTSKSVKYITADALQLPFADETFDVVTAMDFLEHIEDQKGFIREVARVLKPGGRFFFHTFNRNAVSKFVIIKLVEWFVANTPKHMHVIDLFMKPEEVEKACASNGMAVVELTGIKPIFSTITLKGLLSRTVPTDFKFELTKSLKLSYLGYAQKRTH